MFLDAFVLYIFLRRETNILHRLPNVFFLDTVVPSMAVLYYINWYLIGVLKHSMSPLGATPIDYPEVRRSNVPFKKKKKRKIKPDLQGSKLH